MKYFIKRILIFLVLILSLGGCGTSSLDDHSPYEAKVISGDGLTENGLSKNRPKVTVFAETPVSKTVDNAFLNQDSKWEINTYYEDTKNLLGRLKNGEDCDILILWDEKELEEFDKAGLDISESRRITFEKRLVLAVPEPAPENKQLLGDAAPFYQPADNLDEAAGMIEGRSGVIAVFGEDAFSQEEPDYTKIILPSNNPNKKYADEWGEAFFSHYGLNETECGLKGSLTYARNIKDMDSWMELGNINGAVMSEDMAISRGYKIQDVMDAGILSSQSAVIVLCNPREDDNTIREVYSYLTQEDGLKKGRAEETKSTGVPVKKVIYPDYAPGEEGLDKDNTDSIITNLGPSDEDDSDKPIEDTEDEEFILLDPMEVTKLQIQQQYHQNVYYTKEGFIFVGDSPLERGISIAMITLDYSQVPEAAFQSVVDRMHEENPYSWTCGFDVHAHGRALVTAKYEKEQIEWANALIYKNAQMIVDKIITDDMDEMTKVLTVYEWFRRNVSYDNNLGETGFHAYGALIDRVACCQGYAKAMQIIFDVAGLKNCFVGGSNHAFCAVRIDGEWYYTDPTKKVRLIEPREFVVSRKFICDYYWLRRGKTFVY